MSLQQFFSEVSSKGAGGVYHPNRFEVIIPYIGSLRVTKVTIPGFSIGTMEKALIGRAISVAQNLAISEDLAMTILLSKNLKEYDIMNAWKRGHGASIIAYTTSRSAVVNYYDTYTKDITIYPEDKTGKRVMKIDVQSAFPASIAAIEVSHEATDTVASLEVTFKFEDIKITAL